jgi:hypothetical protein
MQAMSYTLNNFNTITFDGFDIKLPDETLKIITELALQVGSPTYIRTPIFTKKDNILRSGEQGSTSTIFSNMNDNDSDFKRKRKNTRAVEILNDADWESIRTFQATVIEQKVGVDAHVDLIRSSLNKMSEKNYIEQSNKIMEILNQLVSEETSELDMHRVGKSIFEIASNNRFFSKLYADLYTLLIKHFQIMRNIFDTNFDTFLEIFKNIESADPDLDYDRFCTVKKNNERRKSLSSFFINLTLNGIIKKDDIIDLVFNLLNQVLDFIKQENKKSEVDEILENIAILYNKDYIEQCNNTIEGESFIKVIERLALSKVKSFPSLSNKSIFKCMDMIEI